MQGIFLVTCLNILSRHTLLEKNALSNFTAIASTKPIIGDIVRNSVNCRFEVPHLRYSPKVMKTKNCSIIIIIVIIILILIIIILISKIKLKKNVRAD